MDDLHNEIEPLSDKESKELWDSLLSRIKAYEERKRKRNIIRYSSLMAAATLVLIASVVAYRSFFLPAVYNAGSNDLAITLKDGSKVTLSKGAKLTVEKSFPSATREVFLEGDAIFQVAKSKTHPFIVHGNGYETKVLGTTFKVTQTGKIFNVHLYEGTVQVTKTDKPKDVFVLHPQETFSNMGTTKVATIVASKNKAESPKGNTATLSFDNAELTDVALVLQQTFGIKIKYPLELGNQKISITKEKTTPSAMMSLISSQLGLNLKNKDDKTFELEK